MTERILFALLPIIILIATGAVLRRRGFVHEDFWPQAERLGYYVLLPCLFFHGMASAHLGAIPVRNLALTLTVSTLIVGGLAVLSRPLAKGDGPAFTSIFQGSVRFNNYVGVTMISGIFGAGGVALAAICNAAIVPTVNVMCVLVFARFGAVRLNARATMRQIATNPLILSSCAGIVFYVLGLGIPDGIEPAVKALGASSLPLGLLCVGAALRFEQAIEWSGSVVFSSIFKFILMPVATLLIGKWLGLGGAALTTAILFQSLPTASSAYVLARQLGGDAPLMAGITAAQTVLALVAMPLAAYALF